MFYYSYDFHQKLQKGFDFLLLVLLRMRNFEALKAAEKWKDDPSLSSAL